MARRYLSNSTLIKATFAILAMITVTAASGEQANAKITKELKEEVIGVIQKGIEAKDPLEKAYAILAAGPLGDRDLDKAIAPYLENTNRQVRHAAIVALASRKDRKGLAALNKEIANAKSGRFLVLSSLMPELPVSVQTSVYKGLIAGRKVDAKVQADVLRYIAEYGAGDVYKMLGQVTKGRKSADRAPYLKVLMQNPKPAAFGWAESLAGSRDAGARLDGLTLAIKIGGSKLDGLARKGLTDKDPKVTEVAAKYLGEKGDPSVVGYMVGLLNSASGKAQKRTIAQTILDKGYKVPLDVATKLVDTESDAGLLALYYQLYGATRENAALERLIKLERSTKIEERKWAVQGLSYTRSKTAMEVVLARTAFDGDPDVRLLSLEGLGNMQMGAAVPVLQKALTRLTEKKYQHAAIKSLGQIQDPKAAELLKYKAFSSDKELKKLVIEGLIHLKEPGSKDIIERLTEDRDAEVRWKCTVLLLELDKAKGMRKLSYALQRPPKDYVYSLLELPDATRDEVLMLLLKNEKENIRTDAIDGVRLMGHEGVALLRKAATSGNYPKDVQEAAVSELLLHGAATDEGFFKRMSQTGTDDEKIAAIGWLTRRATGGLSPFFRTLMNGAGSNKVLRLAALYGLLRAES